MLVYKEYFKANVSIYISHITTFTFPHALPPFDKNYQISPSSSSMTIAFNCHFAISAAVRLDETQLPINLIGFSSHPCLFF